jgi:nicotinate-nucleotide--dimethylbenzimidazole phosphoribosyltransferase
VKKLKETVKNILCPGARVMEEAQRKLDNLTKPRGSLGRLEEFACRVAGITGSISPSVKNKVIFTMAGDHGVACQGVSLYPQEVTVQMVYNFLNGGAGVNVLARHIGSRVVVVDAGIAGDIKTASPIFIGKKVARGTKDFTRGAAMSREEAARSLEAGIEAFEEEDKKERIDIIGLGEMGIANTTAASAITSCITGAAPDETAGRGTGIDDKHLKIKIETIKKALKVNKPDRKDPLDVLSKVGGFEIGALAGLVLAAGARKVPVVVDGFITASAALIASEVSPLVRGYLFASHDSVEKGHAVALKWMRLKPMFDFQMRLGEGTGACLGISMIEAGVKVLNEMATFESAGVSREER